MLLRLWDEFINNRITWLYIMLSFARYFGKVNSLDEQAKRDSHLTFVLLLVLAWAAEKYIHERTKRKKAVEERGKTDTAIAAAAAPDLPSSATVAS